MYVLIDELIHHLLMSTCFFLLNMSTCTMMMISWSMFRSYNGEQSSRKSLPGGGPQGAFLGGLIFIIKFNGALMRPPIPRGVIGPISKSESEKVKYVDDWTVAVSVNLKTSLIKDPVK